MVAACGNATRCVARLVMEESGRARVRLESAAGLLDCARMADGQVRVDMGAPRFAWRDIPLAAPQDTRALDLAFDPSLAGALADLAPLPRPAAANIGNPHCVFFVADAAAIDLARLGPVIEHHPLFPERVNVGFAQILAPDRIRLRVWERGAGATRACGTAACAALACAARLGLAGRAAQVELPGGMLTIEWAADGHLLMTGPAALSFRGEIAPELLDGMPAAASETASGDMAEVQL
jgi:diaminopimelate epimerase